MSATLGHPPRDGDLALEPLTERHRAALKAVCAEDTAIWDIYPVNWAPDGFEAAFDALIADTGRIAFAIIDSGAVIGMTAYITRDLARQSVEIGNSYIRPAARGTGLNGRLKRLMIDHAFACGMRRIELRVDDRNGRSKAAVVKIGGVYEGKLREERITWNGFVRDTCIFSILAHEWPIRSTAG